MRWPFRSKSDPAPRGETDASSGDLHAPGFASSRPNRDWCSLPAAPLAISSRPPRTIVGTTSAIRRPIGFREHADVTEFAAVGVVDGLARITPRSTTGRALPDAPIGEPSALPTITARALRAVPASAAPGPAALTTSASVTVVKPVLDTPRRHDTPPRGPAVTDPNVETRGTANMPRPSLAQSRRLGLGPGYHGALPDAMRQDRLDRTQPSEDEPPVETERVPDDLRTIMRAAYGDDVGDQVVHRGPDVTEEARQLGARAFARDGEVFVPIEAGPLDEAPAKSFLAHELTHLAQQRRRTTPLPAEGSVEGLVLEAEAQRAERFVRGDPGAPAPGPMSAPSVQGADEFADTQRFVNELVHRGVAEPDGSGGVRFLWGHGSGGRVQRATEPAVVTPTTPSMGSRVWTAVTSTFTDDIEEAIERPWGITTEQAENADRTGVDAVARENNRTQLKDKFHSARLEHLKTQKSHGGVLPEDELTALKAQVDTEVASRLDEVKKRAEAQVDRVNKYLVDAKQPVTTPDRLDPDLYDAIYKALFPDDVDAPIPPADDATTIDEKAKQSVAKLKAKAGSAAPEGGAAKPGVATPPQGGPAGQSSPGGQGAPGHGDTAREGVIDSWDDVKGMYATDLASMVTSPFGITLTDAERKDLWNTDTEAKKTAPAQSTTGGSPTGSSGPVAPHGQEMIDLDRLDLEDLTRRLYQRVRSDLRRELLVDRERSGRLNDMR